MRVLLTSFITQCDAICCRSSLMVGVTCPGVGPLGVIFAEAGFEMCIQVGGEAKNPQKNIPRAVILTVTRPRGEWPWHPPGAAASGAGSVVC